MKGYLERASYLAILLKDYKRAIPHEEALVSVCESLYLRGDKSMPHPLIGFHYYKLGKTLSMVDQYSKACEYLNKAMVVLGGFYSIKSREQGGQTINDKLVQEIRENLLANEMLAKTHLNCKPGTSSKPKAVN